MAKQKIQTPQQTPEKPQIVPISKRMLSNRSEAEKAAIEVAQTKKTERGKLQGSLIKESLGKITKDHLVGSAVVGLLTAGASGFSGIGEKISDWKKREWDIEDDAGVVLKDTELHSLKDVLKLTTREKMADRGSKVREWFGLSPQTTYRESRVASLNAQLVESYLYLNLVDHHELRDILSALQGKRGALNPEDAAQVLVAYTFHKGERDRSTRMVDQLEGNRGEVLGRLGEAFYANPDILEKSEVTQHNDLSEEIDVLDNVDKLLVPKINRYKRAFQMTGGLGIREGAATIAGSIGKVLRVAGIETSAAVPADVLDEEYEDILALLNTSVSELNGDTEREEARTLQQDLRIITRFRGSITDAENAGTLQSFHANLPLQQLEGNNILNDREWITDEDGNASQVNVTPSYFMGALQRMRTREQARLNELQSLYGSVDEARDYTSGAVTIPAIDEMRFLQTRLNDLDAMFTQYADGNLALNSTYINNLLVDYDRGNTRMTDNISRLNEEAQRKETENAPTYSQLRQMSERWQNHQIHPVDLDTWVDNIRTQRNTLNSQRASLNIPSEARNVIRLQEQLRKNTDQMAVYQARVDEYDRSDSPLTYYGDVLEKLAGPEILDKLEQEAEIEAALKYAHSETQRQNVVRTLREKSLIATDQEAVQLVEQLEDRTDEFEDLKHAKDEEIDTWTEKMLESLSPYGMRLDDDADMQEVRDAVRESAKAGTGFMELLFMMFFGTIGKKN